MRTPNVGPPCFHHHDDLRAGRLLQACTKPTVDPGAQTPCFYLSLCPAYRFFQPRAKYHNNIQARWTKVCISSAKWEEGNLKGKVGRGWPDNVIHRCISEQIGFGKEYTSNLGTNSLKFLCPGTPWKIFLYPQENAHPSQKYCTITSITS